ncbi:MAG: NADH-quinone oxidoreductase subunit C [Actinomycetales bacterium]|jgi:NADH-quinone oxidoreductase subunit C|nr:NADH-quinone oxidoreductase subunit C [Actinomycetales bacterium]
MADLSALSRVAPEHWLSAVGALREAGFDVFDVLTAYQVEGGLELVLRVLSSDTGAADGLHTQVAFGEPIASLTPVYAGAAWPERELAEQFGLLLSGFRDGTGEAVRRLLLPEDVTDQVPGKPLRMPLRKESELVARRDTPWPGAR